MDIKVCNGRILHPVPADICFIRQDQGGRHHIYRSSRRLIMIADSSGHCEHIFQRHPQVLQNPISQKGSCVGVVMAVNAVADIMHIPRDLAETDFLFFVSQVFQDFSCCLRHFGGMFPRMLCKSQDIEHLVSSLDQ